MIITLEEHKQFLIQLIKHKVEFILIGGYAVNFHGYNRPTSDMDLWLRPDNQNRDKFVKLLRKEGFSEDGITQISHLDFTNIVTFHIGKPPKRIDFLTKISGVNFNDAWEKKLILKMDEYDIPVLHLNHLISSKISNDRTRDKADVEELQKIQKLKKK